MSVKKSNKQFIGFLIVTGTIWLLLEWLIPTKNGYNSVLALKATIMLLIVAGLLISRAVIKAMNNLYLSLSTEEEKEAFEKARKEKCKKWSDWKSIMNSLTNVKPIEEEEEIILDHDFDGIQELDNNLPPWWLYMFYVTIVFGICYVTYYHVLDGDKQTEEYKNEVYQANLAIKAYEATKEKVDLSSLAGGDNAVGKKLFKQNCAVCHAVDGGGKIGPNLTDDHWILGGGVEKVFNTISEGGRPGKGMVAWKNSFSEADRQQLAAYVISLQGTKPAAPKEAQGDIIWAGDKK